MALDLFSLRELDLIQDGEIRNGNHLLPRLPSTYYRRSISPLQIRPLFN